MELTAKEKKAEYDRIYRIKNLEKINANKKAYNESQAGRLMQKKSREKRGQEKQNEYCKKPDQRQKERIRRYKINGTLGILKFCIVCESNKPILEFRGSRIYEDRRYHLCLSCESTHKKELGVTTKGIIQAIVTRCNYRLTRQDVAKHPYFIEANKYLITLKKLVQ